MDTKILIISCDPDVREYQKHFLERRKYQVLTTKNPQEAIELIKANSPDIVLYDIPFKSFEVSLDILPKLKSIKPVIIVYLITTAVDKKLETKALALGAKEVLFKPILKEDLEQKIKEVSS